MAKGTSQVAGDNDPRFSVTGTQVVPIDGKSLVGLHNISAEKLRKALKMGGLANPSTAVIDIARQNHEQYGDISLVMPSAMVDSYTGRNAGTFTGDIWSPTYPSVTKQMSDKGYENYYQTITKLFANNDARQPILSRIKLDFDDYLDRDNVRAGLTYWYLLEKGIEPTDIYYNSGVPEEVKERFKPLAGYLSNLNKEEIDQLIAIIADEKGTTVEQMKQDAQAAVKRYRETIDNPDEKPFRKNIAQKAIGEIEYYGIPYGTLSDAFHRYNNAVQRDGKIDLDATLIAAQDLVKSQYQADFDKWLADMDKRFDIKEVIFTGYDNEGDRKYIPHTLANASKMMNKERLQNAGSNGGLSATRGQLVEKMLSLAEIRANKNRLRPGEEEDHETEEWNKLGDEWFEKILGPLSDMQKISDNPFSNTGYAEQRLQEALLKANPVAYLNKEYGYKIGENSEWAKNLKDLVQRIKSLPTKYFETKFRRPVYLDEFRNAVVPNDLPTELRDGLEKAGLTLFEYDPKEEGARRAATLQATEDEGIRFSVSGGLDNDRTLTKAAREEMQQIKDAALADGTFMKAHNGKRSNLNERQWLQVRTRAFQRMFGDWQNDPENATKVLDENGEPMVVYHNTPKEFTAFDPKKSYKGIGFWFSEEPFSHYGDNLISAFLNLRNPIDYEFDFNSEVPKAGENGVIFHGETEAGKPYRFYIVGNPNQIKSATHNDGSFSEENDDIRFSVSNASEEIFFSNAERAVESIKQEKATPAQWLAMIEKAGGLKAGEDKWLGLSEWLKAQHATVEKQPGETRSQYIVRLGEASKKFTVSKQDILDYIRQNKIQIEEVEYGEYDMQDAFEGYRREYKQYYDEAVADNAEEPQEVAWQRMIDEHGDDFDMGFYAYGDELQWDADSDYVKWELENSGESGLRPIDDTRMRYTTHGLQNKREIALVVPTIESWNEDDNIHFGDAGDGRAVAWVRFGDTDRTLVDGRDTYANVLVIDEIQSKRHQEGREKGYKGDIEKERLELLKRVNAAQQRIYEIQSIPLDDRTDEQITERGRLLEQIPQWKAEIEDLRVQYLQNAIPAAPFEKNWHELAMKRILRFAAENGYDKVAWTTGEQQAERYDIGKEIDHIVKTDDYSYEVYPTHGLMMNLDFDEDGIYRDDSDREYNGKSMSDIFGKELAKRLQEMPVDETLQGDGLRVGYDGMKGFYDDMLPRFMQKYGKKWGVQVGEVTMPDLEQGYQTMHSVDITPEMRESVLQGQPMFSVTGNGWKNGGNNAENLHISDKIRNFAAQIVDNAKKLIGNSDSWTQRPGRDSGRVPYEAAGRMAATADRGDIRVLEPELPVSDRVGYFLDLPRTVQRERTEEESKRLIELAKENGLFVERKDTENYGKRVAGSSRESVVYQDKEHGKHIKVKDPYALAVLKGNYPEDAIYEHIIHNLLFPDTRYTFMGISEDLGDMRFVLSQETVDAIRNATDKEVDAYMKRLGLRKADKYTYENDMVRVTDVTGDNALVDKDGHVRFIDPVISLKVPARQILNEVSDAAMSDFTMDAQPGESKVQYAARIAEEIKRQNPKDTSLDEAIRFSITVNHNSPYLLKRADGAFVDPETGERLGFDLRFIGKGEGGQAHGWGSYFSQNDIEGYRQVTKTYKDEPVAADPYSDNAADRALFYYEQEGGTQKAVKFLRELMREEDDADTKREYQECIDVLLDEKSWGERKGHRYIVEIPDNDGTNYLEEMKTLPKPLRRKIAAAVRELPGKPESSIKYVDYVGGWNQLADMIERNQWAYLEIRDRLFNAFGGYPIDSEKRLSKMMSSLGFVGIHYDGRRDGECYVIFNPDDAIITDHIRFSVTGDQSEEENIRFSVVTSRKKIAELEAGEKIKVYRAAQVIDGKLYPPMAAKQQGQLVKPIELGRWEQAEEHPELAKDGKFKLDKANGSSAVPAAYNPYFHTSRSPLNDQFSSAYDRPNLVTLEVEVPASELTSGYKAEGAKDAVGETSWHSGAVSGKLAKAGEPRKVILSRWDKPLRIVPDAEVAEKIAGMLSGKDIAIPYNVVTPSLRAELEKQGVTISDTPSGTVKKPKEEIRFSVNNPSTLIRSEMVTKALVQQANNNYNIMQSALKKVTADLKGIREAMRMQSDYDRKVVDALLNLYNTLLQENGVWAQYMPDTTRRIATQIVHAIGKQNITEEVNTIMDHMVHAQAKAAQRQWDKLRQTPIDKINIRGVVMQGKVALEGQHALKAMNDALQANITIELIEEQINQLMNMEDNATDESLKTQYKGQWIGLTIAAQHLERLQHLREERLQLELELQSAQSNKALKPAARQQLVDNIKQAMRDNYIEQAEAYTRSTQDLSEYVNTQHAHAKDFIRRLGANRDKIRSYAQRDLEGLATNPNRNRTKGNVARSLWDAFASPIRDLQSLLRLTGLHAPDGEGYLYNHFVRNWMNGADMERTGIVAASKTLDEKIAELTHGKYKTWEEAARKINDASHNMFGITMLNGVDGKDMPVTEEIPLNAGNALYIYAVNKMNDGRMKLNGMNITEEDVQALADKVREQFGQEILDVVDWVQSEFFSQLRNRYNPTYEALFGAPMDAIENYFPLRINANARQQNEDLSEPDTDAARLLAGTIIGAIIRRTRNSLPLDVRNADFFQEVIRHISQMERWNAFAQWNRDANILFSDINFRNRIKGMKGTIYGEGDKLFNYMKDAFRVAIGTYKPKTDTFSEITLNMAKGVTSAKINFRIFTALKQIASFPAFFTYMHDGTFVQSYLRNWLKPHETMKWAKENLPNFEKRVSKRDMGDMRLMQRSTDWQWNKRILEWSSKCGMFFNVFFDTLTCATGARAVYDSHLADYLKKGYSEEDARNRARQDAEIAFNTSQQSSEGAFMSAVQQDRNLVTAALTVFRTSPIQYTRNFFYHVRGLLRKIGEGKRDEQIAFRMGQYKNDGLNDEQARKAAEKDYNKSLRQDIVGVVVYGALLNILWRLAGQMPYLLLGDDDDKKKQILDDATSGGAWFSPFTGLLGGGIVESALDGNGSVADMFAPEMPFTQDIKRAGQYLENDKYAEFASQALSVLMQSGTGFDPLTASDVVSRIVTTLDSEEELDAATQAIRVSQALLSIPQSQYEQMLIDKVVSGETDEDAALEDYIRYQKIDKVADRKKAAKAAALEDYIRYQKIHTAPLTWWLRGEESDEKAEENAEKRFNKLLTDRDKIKNPEGYEE